VTTTPPLRREPDFRRYWAARTISFGGSIITWVVMPVLVYRLTGSGLWTAAVAASESLPYLCFGLVAGVLGDRLDRRRVMVATDVLNAALLATVPAAYLAGGLTAPHVVAVATAVQTLFVFFDAANFGALPALAGRDRLAAATASVHGAGTVLDLTMPMAAGAAVAIVPPPLLLTVDLVSFLVSAALIAGIRAPLNATRERTPGGTRWRTDIVDGLRFLVRHPVIRVQTIVSLLLCFSFGSFLGQLVPFADKALHVSSHDIRLGALYAGWGLGGILATVSFPWLVRRFGEVWILLGCLPTAAVLGVAAATARHWLVAAFAIAAWSVPLSTGILNAVTLRAKVTPDRLQSRVNTAGRMLGFGTGTPIGAVVGGLLSQGYGVRFAFFAAIAAQATATVVAWLSPLRRLRHDPAAVSVPD
jgi:MFS family permease